MMAAGRSLLTGFLPLMMFGSAEAFISVAPIGQTLETRVFAGANLVTPTAIRGTTRARGCFPLQRSSQRGIARMLSGQEFATCSGDEFRAYIIGWTFAWSGIIPYTFIAVKNVLEPVVSAKLIPAVSKGEDATVSNQSILLYKDPIKLLDVVNIVGRFETYDDVQTVKAESGKLSDFLRRDTFKESLRRRKFKGWPRGMDGQPALIDAFGGDVRAASRAISKRELSESTMDAVFDSFCGSPLSMMADRFKVDNQLDNWRKDATFDVKGFEGGLLFGRFVFLSTILSVLALELAGYWVFFIEPIIIRYGNPLSGLGF